MKPKDIKRILNMPTVRGELRITHPILGYNETFSIKDIRPVTANTIANNLHCIIIDNEYYIEAQKNGIVLRVSGLCGYHPKVTIPYSCITVLWCMYKGHQSIQTNQTIKP